MIKKPIKSLPRKNSFSAKEFENVMEKLYEHQKKNFIDVYLTLKKYKLCYNSSEMGLGKTHILAAIAKATGKTIIVIGPDNIREGWESAFRYHGVADYAFVGYNTFLCREKPIFLQDPDNYDVWCPSEEFVNLVNQPGGIHLVFDEAHMLKNSNTSRFSQAVMLAREATVSKESTLTLLSASPLEISKHAETICQLLGFMNNSNDIETLRNKCIQLFGPIPAEQNPQSLFDWFTQIIVPKLFFFMDPIPHKMVVDNQFIRLNQDQLNQMNAGINLLDPDAEPAYYYSTRMKFAECGKIMAYCHEFLNILRNEPNTKLVIMVNYTSSIDYLVEQLKQWNPIIVSGDSKYKTSNAQRNILKNQFQEPNLNRRLIIGNTQMLAFGIDLDDKDGRFPRKIFISPSDKMNNMYQASKRADRGISTKSVAIVKFMYIMGLQIDTKVLQRTQIKSDALKSILRYKSILPGDLEIHEDMFIKN